jgi:hypothetical protein
MTAGKGRDLFITNSIRMYRIISGVIYFRGYEQDFQKAFLRNFAYSILPPLYQYIADTRAFLQRN